MNSTNMTISSWKRLSLLICLFALISISLFGFSCNNAGYTDRGGIPDSGVSGFVFDSVTGQPIDSALVSSAPDTVGADDHRVDYSDSTGEYMIHVFAPGWNYVRCSKPGYITDSLRVYYGGSVVNDSVDFLLIPE